VINIKSRENRGLGQFFLPFLGMMFLISPGLHGEEDPFQALFEGDKEEITHFADSPGSLPVLNHWEGMQAWARQLPDLDSNLNVEVLFTLPRPGGNDLQDSDLKSMIMRALSDISGLQGLEYFSASRGKMRLLFKQAFRVPKVFEERPLPDPQDPNPLARQRFVVFQEDLTFGKNYFSVLILPLADGFGLYLRNLNTMYYGILPLVDEGNLIMAVKIGIHPQGLSFYGLSSVKTGSFFGIENSRQDSFYNRIKALFEWFNRNLKEEGAAS
jgi:hypothetical protein